MRSRLALGLVLGVAGAFVGFGCDALRPPRTGEPVPTSWDSAQERAYQNALERYSRRGEVFSGLDTRMFVAAVFQTPKFREARIRREAEFQRQPRDWPERTLKKEIEESAAFYDVMLGVHINDTTYEDIARESSMWRIALATSAGEVNAVKVERIGKGNVPLSAYYPWLDPFWVLYRVRFPRVLAAGGELIFPGADTVSLKIASPMARLEMAFPVQ